MFPDYIELSIVMPSFNRAPLLERGLSTIFRQRYFREKLRAEVIVVDNSSTREHRDATCRVVESFQERFATGNTDVRYVYARKNDPEFANCSYPRNVGLRLSRAAIILITDAEVLHVSETIHQHWIRQSEADNLMVLGFCRDCPSDLPLVPESLSEALNDENHDIRISSTVMACWAPFCASVRRKWAMAIGGWDEDFTVWGSEDHDFGRRLQLMEVAMLHDDQIKVLHQAHDKDESGGQVMLKLHRQKAREGNITANVGREWGKIGVLDDLP